MLTRQEMFDKAVGGLRAQGTYASVRVVFSPPHSLMSDYTSCRYRTEDGRKCAFGFLIADINYDPAMEGKGAYAVMRKWLPHLCAQDDWSFVTKLQDIHDAGARVDLPFQETLLKYRELAELHELSTRVLD